ncbi:hypothetical protein BDD12DRAFT_821946 [Trichophaea hybrida]|nr:hypothetical protein BDD12DRAFT_821946 [Trichophaea hybrida]
MRLNVQRGRKFGIRLKVQRGIYQGSYDRMSIADLSSCSSRQFAKSLRPLCEAIYWTLVNGYVESINAYYILSDKTSQKQGRP